MPDFTVSRAHSGTTPAGGVDTVMLKGDRLRILNRGAVWLWVRDDGVDPGVAADECIPVPPGDWIPLLRGSRSSGAGAVKLTSGTLPTAYTIWAE